MRKLPYNDEWILEHSHQYRSYRELAEAHNRLFNTDFSRAQMKNHANLILGIRMDSYWYTNEMKDWIRKEYPKEGSSDEKARKFNEIFGTTRSGHSIREMARRLGVSLSEDALQDYKKKSKEHICNYNRTVRAKPIGYVGRPSNGYPMVKTENGWISQARYEYLQNHEGIRNGDVIIFLDGNVHNVGENNLMAIPQKWQALMTFNKFWSKHPKITETGIKWCELKDVLERSGYEFTL